jgi:MoaA/NifB/PqqE/SkfB family radical SAM enzyme
MNDDVVEMLLSNLKTRPASRVRLVGTGEATLHSRFKEIAKEIIEHSKYVTLVTNGHWNKSEMAEIISTLNFGMVEFSIDAGNDIEYFNSRKGKLQKVINNFLDLKAKRDKLQSNTLINVRLMIRPSMKHLEKFYLNKYKKMADSVFVQHITVSRNFDYTKDVFFYKQKKDNSVPKCTLPSKDLEIRFNGDVLLCGPSSRQIGEPGLVAGNILKSSIVKIWNGEIFKNYRTWHKNKTIENLSLCKGCNGF